MDLKRKISLGFNLLIALGGTMFLFIGWNAWKERYQIVQNGIQTQGIVVENVHRPTRGLERQSTALAPVVSFTTSEGKTVRYYSQTYTTPAQYTPGTVVDVWYLPDNPQEATMEGVDAWVFPTVFGIFGTAMCLIGYIGLIGMWFKKQTPST